MHCMLRILQVQLQRRTSPSLQTLRRERFDEASVSRLALLCFEAAHHITDTYVAISNALSMHGGVAFLRGLSRELQCDHLAVYAARRLDCLRPHHMSTRPLLADARSSASGGAGGWGGDVAGAGETPTRP